MHAPSPVHHHRPHHRHAITHHHSSSSLFHLVCFFFHLSLLSLWWGPWNAECCGPTFLPVDVSMINRPLTRTRKYIYNSAGSCTGSRNKVTIIMELGSVNLSLVFYEEWMTGRPAWSAKLEYTILWSKLASEYIKVLDWTGKDCMSFNVYCIFHYYWWEPTIVYIITNQD